FKIQKGNEDFEANVKRLELAGIWDEIVEMLKRYELPDRLDSNDNWIELGTKFRKLVEPLDIANYYRHSKDNDTGTNLSEGGVTPPKWATAEYDVPGVLLHRSIAQDMRTTSKRVV
ncbi:EDS1L-like protein, partial [Tanacetum coccineum]